MIAKEGEWKDVDASVNADDYEHAYGDLGVVVVGAVVDGPVMDARFCACSKVECSRQQPGLLGVQLLEPISAY